MSKFFVSVRGFVNHPCIIRIDLDACTVEDVLEFPEIELPGIPENKRGFAGLGMLDGNLVAATWDRICIIDPQTHAVIETITDKRFSDLHSLHVEPDGTIWVTSTNIDGIYTVANGSVEPFWHAWQKNGNFDMSPLGETDYRALTKDNCDLYACHINSVYADEERVYASYLGQGLSYQGVMTRFLVKTGMKNRYRRFGGTFVIDKSTRRTLLHTRSEGLHDLFPGPDGVIYSTIYFGNALQLLDSNGLRTRELHLDYEPYAEGDFLTRGVFVANDGIWAGFTTHRDKLGQGYCAHLRKFDGEGRWTGTELKLENYSGVYTLIPDSV